MHRCCSVPPDRRMFNLADCHQVTLARPAISGVREARCAERIAGRHGRQVDHQLGTADVTFIPGRVAPDVLARAVGRAGENRHAYAASRSNGSELSAV